MTTLPAGWKLVPEAMTLEMSVAFAEVWYSKLRVIDDDDMQDAYAAMLAAAPEAPPIAVSLDPDPRGVSVGVWQGSSCIYNGAHAVPASVAPGDAQDERQAFEAWAKRKKMPLARIGQQYDDFWVDHAWNGWQARAALAAPAAGDALPNFDIEAAAQKMAECMDYPWAHMPEQGRTHMRKYAQAVIDAALAAQVPQQGEA